MTIPFRGWTLDADNFQTRANNFFDHNNIGESNIFIPVTIDGALIQGWELTLSSPRVWHRGQFHLAYSNQVAKARGAITGGLICFPPTDPSCQPAPGYGPLDHDQRNTLNVGFNATLPWNSYVSTNVYYGSGFTNGSPNEQFPGPYLPQHTTFDLAIGKHFGERFTASLTALNVANRHLLIDNSVTFGGFHYNDPRQIYVEVRYRFHYATDVRMIQRRSGLRFALEAAEGLRVFRNLIRQKLQGDKAVQLYVLGLVDDAHPTAAELLFDAIVRNSLADQRVGGWHGGAHLGLRYEASQRSQNNCLPALAQHEKSKNQRIQINVANRDYHAI